MFIRYATNRSHRVNRLFGHHSREAQVAREDWTSEYRSHFISLKIS